MDSKGDVYFPIIRYEILDSHKCEAIQNGSKSDKDWKDDPSVLPTLCIIQL